METNIVIECEIIEHNYYNDYSLDTNHSKQNEKYKKKKQHIKRNIEPSLSQKIE